MAADIIDIAMYSNGHLVDQGQLRHSHAVGVINDWLRGSNWVTLAGSDRAVRGDDIDEIRISR